MKRIFCLLMALGLLFALCACAEKEQTPVTILTPAPTLAPPTAEPTPEQTESTTEAETAALPEAPLGLNFYAPTDSDEWITLYRSFLENSFDVIAALWPDGISGIGFVDLDLDGTPEMLMFDMGASAAMGVQIFDIANGAVVCVSSVNEAAAAAFGGDYFSPVSVCAQLFEDFRLVNDGEQTFFTVHSANGTAETFWEESIRFGRDANDVVTLQSLCRCETVNDVENNAVLEENCFVLGQPSSRDEYDTAQQAVADAADLGYEAFGTFQWNDMDRYDTSLEGLLVLLDDAAAGYVSILG